eukprot:m.151836 g.151836  ORF g.151836 m.151836 type:complete len:121 (+) comp14308_c0_seq3:498-860(+)
MAAGDWSAAGPALPSGDPRRLEAAGGQRGPRRAARLNRSDLLMENPQKTLFTSDGDRELQAPPEPTLNLRALEREVREFNFCNGEAQRIVLKGTQDRLKGLLDGLETDQWRFQPATSFGF